MLMRGSPDRSQHGSFLFGSVAETARFNGKAFGTPEHESCSAAAEGAVPFGPTMPFMNARCSQDARRHHGLLSANLSRSSHTATAASCSRSYASMSSSRQRDSPGG